MILSRPDEVLDMLPPRNVSGHHEGTVIRYEKYSTAGNTFLVVDESDTPLVNDAARSEFSCWALDGGFGVGGADNVLFIAETPRPGTYTFRIFEHDGAETLSCGNGLLAAGHLIAQRHGRTAWTMLTELPSGRPRPVRGGLVAGTDRVTVRIAGPRQVPERFWRPRGPVAPPTGGDPGPAEVTLPVSLPSGEDETGKSTVVDRDGPGTERDPALRGFLVFTGEPHLVLVLGHGADEQLAPALFPPRRTERSLALMDALGRQINERHRAVFPHGIHVNVAQIHDGCLRFRTWERAIDKETLACGTGALACVHVCAARGLLPEPTTVLWPHHARWHRPDTELRVTRESDGALVLQGAPVRIYAGTVPAGQLPQREDHTR
uniref:Diaminopimelate epimerase n=1 Tax=Streptomyces sp. NBC_00008 TaxID=2903610 RepID=A0AAU2VMG0_9ACTN